MERRGRLAVVTALLLTLLAVHGTVVHAGVYKVREDGSVLFVEPDWRGFENLMSELGARRVNSLYIVHACAANYTRLVEFSSDARIAGYVTAALSGRCESKPLSPPYNIIFASVVQGLYRCGDVVILVLYSASGVRVYSRTAGGEAKLGIVYRLAYARDEYERVESLARLAGEATRLYQGLLAKGVEPVEALRRVVAEYGVPPARLVLGRLPVAEILVNESIAGMLGEERLASLIEAKLGGARALLVILSRECTGAEGHGATSNTTRTVGTTTAAPRAVDAGNSVVARSEESGGVERGAVTVEAGGSGASSGAGAPWYTVAVLAAVAAAGGVAAYAARRRR